jgi:signal transduction histidine kinase
MKPFFAEQPPEASQVSEGKSEPGWEPARSAEEQVLLDETPTLVLLFRILCVFGIYMLAIELLVLACGWGLSILRLLRFYPFCACIAVIACVVRPIKKVEKKTVLMGLFICSVFLYFLLDITRDIPWIDSAPAFGPIKSVRRQLLSLIEVSFIFIFIVASYIALVDAHRLRQQLSQEMRALQLAQEEKLKLEAQNRHLQKSESLGLMAGAIAHHFNNQLQTVMMGLELVMSDPNQNAGLVQKLSIAMQSARNAVELSGLMLTYLGQTVIIFGSLDLSQVCRSHVASIQSRLPENVTLEVDLPSPGPFIKASESHIQQVLMCLATNAWEAIGDKKGVIRIQVRTASPGEYAGAARFPVGWQPRDGSYACMEVIDSGCGIPESDIDKIFDPFFSSKFVGRGLGLAVVLGIVRSHQGGVTVDGVKGGGSVFRVYLPLTEETRLELS